jgi:hypothetical protein
MIENNMPPVMLTLRELEHELYVASVIEWSGF